MVDPQFVEECLKYHNTLRALHNSPELVIDIKLNDFAQEWADIIAAEDTLKHRQKNDYGENIYVCYSEESDECDLEPGIPVQTWYDEISAYEFGEQSPSNICNVSQFTQLVWRSTEKLGIGIATSESGKVYVVCNYEPPGNIAGKFADNVAPKQDDEADSIVPDQTTDSGSLLDLNTPEFLALARLKAIPEEELRVWAAWLTKVAEVVLGEWQQWLEAHVQLAARINNQLLKARQEIEDEKGRANVKQFETDDIEALHDLEDTLQSTDAAAATHDDVDKEAVDDKEEASAAVEKAEFRDVASTGIVPIVDDDILKRIPMPRDAEEMLRIVRKFRRRAKKYQSLYTYWLAQADRVMEEINGKSTTEQLYIHKEIPSFFYLRDEADADSRIDDKEEENDVDDDVEMPSGPLERISCRGDLHLFFNLTDQSDDIEEPIYHESSED